MCVCRTPKHTHTHSPETHTRQNTHTHTNVHARPRPEIASTETPCSRVCVRPSRVRACSRAHTRVCVHDILFVPVLVCVSHEPASACVCVLILCGQVPGKVAALHCPLSTFSSKYGHSHCSSGLFRHAQRH